MYQGQVLTVEQTEFAINYSFYLDRQEVLMVSVAAKQGEIGVWKRTESGLWSRGSEDGPVLSTHGLLAAWEKNREPS